MQQERLIRKYTNRRLYDTGSSSHVTLEDLRRLIVAGEKIKVIDDKSGEDLTRAVLLQIISEQEQFGQPVLGPDLLEMIIRFYGRPMQALLTRYLEQAFTTMLRQQESMQVEWPKRCRRRLRPLRKWLARTWSCGSRCKPRPAMHSWAAPPPAPNAADSSNAADGQKSAPQTDHKKEK